MSQNLHKPKKTSTDLHPRDPQSPQHAEWVRDIKRGLRQAKQRRVDNGLLTPQQVSAESCIPLGSIKRLLDSGELLSVKVNARRRFVRRSTFEAWLKKAEAESAA